jgi:hypothetical protein
VNKILITEKQYKRLLETGSNSAAMDLDIYVQPVHYDTSNGNENLEDSLEEIMNKLKELNSLFKVGKKINQDTKNKIFSVVDELNSIYDTTKEGT